MQPIAHITGAVLRCESLGLKLPKSSLAPSEQRRYLLHEWHRLFGKIPAGEFCRAIELILQTQSFFPTPAEIFAALRNIRPPKSKVTVEPPTERKINPFWSSEPVRTLLSQGKYREVVRMLPLPEYIRTLAKEYFEEKAKEDEFIYRHWRQLDEIAEQRKACTLCALSENTTTCPSHGLKAELEPEEDIYKIIYTRCIRYRQALRLKVLKK